MDHDNGVRDWSRGAVLLAICGVVSCGSRAEERVTDVADGSAPGGGSPRAYIQVRAELADGATNVGQGPFKVSYYGAGRVVDDAALADLTAQLTLHSWPEGAVVPSTVKVGPLLPTPTVTGNSAVVEVTPGAPLDDRWYSLELGPARADVMTTQTLPSGAAGVRLRPGSHPAVTLIIVCTAPDGSGSKVIVDFSEAVTAANPAEMITVAQDGQALSCRFDALQPEDLHEFCSTLVPGPLNVTLPAGKGQGEGGAPLAPGDWTFDTRTLPFVESACLGYRVPL